MRGYQSWILLCAFFLASLGLDTNSAAVIIGAMGDSTLLVIAQRDTRLAGR